MKPFLFLAVFSLGLVSAGCLTRSAEGQKSIPEAQTHAGKRVPVIVELFTSEGCSSCPPADRALKFLAEQQPIADADIIPLAFHVDYWNYLGWKDRFSSPAFSRRQELYVSRFGLDSSYTPEMVVDGRAEFVGNDTGRAAKLIADVTKDEKGSVILAVEGNAVNATITDIPDHHPATVFLAVVEDGIRSEVRGGENKGQTFDHASVVRSLTALGLVDKGSTTFAVKGSIPEISDWRRDNSRFVVFVQDNVSRRIIAAGVVKP